MMENHIQQFIKSIEVDYQLAWKEFYQNLEPRTFYNKQIVTRAGEVERYLYFVEHGALSYFFSHSEKEYNVALDVEGNFVSSFFSFYHSAPSRYSLRSLGKCVLLGISKPEFDRLLLKFTSLKHYFESYQEKRLVQLQEHVEELLALDVKQRFSNFMEKSPSILSQLPQKEVASFLRIDPTNFNKLLHKYNKTGVLC